MLDYTLALAKRDFDNGHLDRFVIDRVVMQSESQWVIRLGHGASFANLVDQRTKQVRCFKSLDGVVSTLEKIGFRVDALVLLSR